MTTAATDYTLNFDYGSVKESHSSVKKQMKDGTYKTYVYKQKETSITLQRSRFMQNFVAYNYEKLKLMKNIDITDVITQYYQSIYENDKDYKYSPQTISKCMRYDAKNYANEIKERKITQAHPIQTPQANPNNVLHAFFPNDKPEAQRKFKTLLVASLNTTDFDMRRVRNTDHDINDQDELDLFCSAVVKGTEFDFKPMITYILRAERFLSGTSSKHIASDIIMDGNIWLDWFIPYNFNLLFRIVEQYAKDNSILTKKSFPTDTTVLIHDNIGIIARICKFLSPYKINDQDIGHIDVLKIILKHLGKDLNPYSFNGINNLNGVDNYDTIDSYRQGTSKKINVKPLNAADFL